VISTLFHQVVVWQRMLALHSPPHSVETAQRLREFENHLAQSLYNAASIQQHNPYN
jgi:uncharacterized membrane protein